nr:hypothetical protein [Tanacetum cinerariifolium]
DSTRPKARGVVMQEPSENPQQQYQCLQKFKTKEKGIMVEKPLKIKKKDQNSFDEQEARRLQAEISKEERLKQEEQEQLTDAEKAKLFMEFMDKRRKFFAAKRTEEKRNRPPTRAQQRSIMCTYLKNIDGWK